jgi:hypothetical protein
MNNRPFSKLRDYADKRLGTAADCHLGRDARTGSIAGATSASATAAASSCSPRKFTTY